MNLLLPSFLEKSSINIFKSNSHIFFTILFKLNFQKESNLKILINWRKIILLNIILFQNSDMFPFLNWTESKIKLIGSVWFSNSVFFLTSSFISIKFLFSRSIEFQMQLKRHYLRWRIFFPLLFLFLVWLKQKGLMH